MLELDGGQKKQCARERELEAPLQLLIIQPGQERRASTRNPGGCVWNKQNRMGDGCLWKGYMD